MSTPESEILAQAFGPILFGLLLRSSFLVLAGAIAVWLLRSRTAELRHLVCHATLVGILLLPLMEWAAPPLRHSSATLAKAELAVFPGPRIASIGSGLRFRTATNVREQRAPSWRLLILSSYVFIAGALLSRLLVNCLRLKGLASRSEPIVDPAFYELAQEVWLESLSRYRPRIRVSKDIRVPMAIGLDEVIILLPTTWPLWSREKLRAALIHEMAHVRRDDPQTAFLVSLAASLFWLNPLVYWLRRRLSALAEEACDEAALLDFAPETYARILIEFASEVGRHGSRLATASSVAIHRSLIKTRLEHIFSVSGRVQRGQAMLRAFLIALFIPALYLAASARFGLAPSAAATQQPATPPVGNEQQADQAEAQLRQDPENLSLRDALMAFYANTGNKPAFTPHLLWVIGHHPEASPAALKIYPRPAASTRPPQAITDERIAQAWERALQQHADSSEVLFHAGLFFESGDPKARS